ncbi:hypothetical protein IKL64_06905 [bacterium]|nr:hypothetical protein [bacterium]
MKFLRLFFTFLIIGFFTGLCADAVSRRPLYSNDYAHRLDVCGAYQENYFYNIREAGQILNLKTSESVIGIRGGKCATRSVIYLRQYPRPIGEIQCYFTEKQRKNLAAKITAALNSPREEQLYRQTYASYVRDPEVCKILDFTED